MSARAYSLPAISLMTLAVATHRAASIGCVRSAKLDLLVFTARIVFEARVHLGAMRNAPSSRMVSPFNMGFSRMAFASLAYSGARPRRAGKGTLAPNDS